jgi:hypothetical protein
MSRFVNIRIHYEGSMPAALLAELLDNELSGSLYVTTTPVSEQEVQAELVAVKLLPEGKRR